MADIFLAAIIILILFGVEMKFSYSVDNISHELIINPPDKK